MAGIILATVVLFTGAFWASELCLADATTEGGGIVYIVNAENPVTTLSLSDVRNYFLKRQRQWPDGTEVRFFDRKPNSSERVLFLKNVIEMTAKETDMYWIGQKLYSGNSAPLQGDTDNMAIQLIASFKGGISYIAATNKQKNDKIKIIEVK